MDLALSLAEEAAAAGEAPVGAVIVENGAILAAARNRMRELNDPTAHAELLAIRAALAARGTGRLDGCDLYVTLEPCAMCAGAIAHSPHAAAVLMGRRIPRPARSTTACGCSTAPTRHHHPEVISGIGERRSSGIAEGVLRGAADLVAGARRLAASS